LRNLNATVGTIRFFLTQLKLAGIATCGEELPVPALKRLRDHTPASGSARLVHIWTFDLTWKESERLLGHKALQRNARQYLRSNDHLKLAVKTNSSDELVISAIDFRSTQETPTYRLALSNNGRE
jgi:hypothetical protein